MNWVEIVAALLGVINVTLVVRRSLWNYPFGVAMVTLYFFVFVEARLYSDALLQIFFLVIQLYGWRNWSRSARVDDGVAVETLRPATRAIWLSVTLVAAAGWGWAMASLTDAAAPYIDATVAALSVSAQLLQSLRKAESWLLWIAVDLIAIPLFLSRELYFTAGLYGLFLILAVIGLLAWWRRVPAQP